SNNFIRNISWSLHPLTSTGGYNRELALAVAYNSAGQIAIRLHYIPTVHLKFLV
ncbi:hypothetical protein BC835DRAFT_1279136, partial [Cytidiella melzeri]